MRLCEVIMLDSFLLRKIHRNCKKMVMYHKSWFSGEYISMETKQLVKSLRYLNANRLLLDLNGGHDSHQNLWMTYEDSNGTGLQSLETITVFYTSFLVS